MSLEKTYELAANPPAPMSWEEYERRVKAEWTALLDSDEGCTERLIHNFLVKHPSMIPGAYSVTGPSGHGPFPCAVLSESPLSGLGFKVPDFIWLASDSCNFTPVFIEIESPCKLWFKQDEVPRQNLTQALSQLGSWRAWLNRPESIQIFFSAFKIPDDLRDKKTFRPEFVLIYGRRREFEERPQLARLRSQFEQHGQVVMTFDRLAPASDCCDYISATLRDGRYQALAVPAPMTLGPSLTERLTCVEGVEEAIRSNDWISTERRQFLIERIPYWKNWASLSRQGIIAPGDRE
jgi:hypothetical protein